MHLLPDVDPHLVGEEVHQRQVAVAVGAQRHRQEEEEAGEHNLDGLEGEDLVGAVAPPHHHGHRQQDEVLEEGLPRREADGVAEAAAVLDRDDRGAEQREHREEEHRGEGEIEMRRMRTLKSSMQPIISSAPHSQMEKAMLAGWRNSMP